MKRDSCAPLIVAIVLLLLPVLYVGSYLALVTPQGRAVFDPADQVFRINHYRVGKAKWLPVFYWPLESIDVKMRPGAWKDPL
jgi:hypothetical protein